MLILNFLIRCLNILISVEIRRLHSVSLKKRNQAQEKKDKPTNQHLRQTKSKVLQMSRIISSHYHQSGVARKRTTQEHDQKAPRIQTNRSQLTKQVHQSNSRRSNQRVVDQASGRPIHQSTKPAIDEATDRQCQQQLVQDLLSGKIIAQSSIFKTNQTTEWTPFLL